MIRQTDGRRLFRAARGTNTRGAVVASHSHDEARLLFAASGTMQVYTDSGRWLVPPQLAVWIPVGVPHRIDLVSDAELRMIYWDASASRDWAPSRSLDRAFALRVTPTAPTRADPRGVPGRRRAREDRTRRPIDPSQVHRDAGCADFPAAAVERDRSAGGRPGFGRPPRAARYRRTRVASRNVGPRHKPPFPAETGLTDKAWRQRARIVLAIDQFSKESAIAEVAASAGFASPAAFCFAFRHVTRMTATAF